MRKQAYVTIGGKTFELGNSAHCATDASDGAWCAFRMIDIFDVYRRPSTRKLAIWKEWCAWAEHVHYHDSTSYCGILIAGHNSCTFSIEGKCRIDNAVYRLWITKEHNRAYRIA